MFQEDIITNFYSPSGIDFDIDYIDIGANDPVVINNTYLDYTSGKSGLNIDGNHELIKLYSVIRPRDISVCAWVSESEGAKELFVANNSHVTTLVRQHTQLSLQEGWCDNYTTGVVQTTTLVRILMDNKITSAKKMYIDVEGGELDVLKSFKFEMLRVGVVCVEIHLIDNERIVSNKVFSYFLENGFRCVFFDSFNFYFKKFR